MKRKRTPITSRIPLFHFYHLKVSCGGRSVWLMLDTLENPTIRRSCFPSIEFGGFPCRPMMRISSGFKAHPVTRASRVSKAAAGLTRAIALTELTKWRFAFGRDRIPIGAVLSFVGHLNIGAQYLTDNFTNRSWCLTWTLLALGVAFAG